MFKFIVTGYNCSDYIVKSLSSAKNQTFENFECIFVNDFSTDNTKKLAFDLVGADSRFRIVDRDENKGGMYNIYHGILMMNPNDEDVIVTLDGDDWLAHDRVLERVAQEYEKGAWMTYGSYVIHPGDNKGESKPLSNDMVETNGFRDCGGVPFSHLRTFKFFLFNEIDVGDFKRSDGTWFRKIYDLPFMYPMLEMCPRSRLSFIEDILYVYTDNPLNTRKVFSSKKDELNEIKAKKRYKKLGESR